MGERLAYPGVGRVARYAISKRLKIVLDIVLRRRYSLYINNEPGVNEMSVIEKAKNAILAAARKNPNISADGLNDEMERGDIAGWLSLSAVRACTFSEWTAAMCAARDALKCPSFE